MKKEVQKERNFSSNDYLEPPLGHLQAMILKTLLDLGEEGFGYKVIEKICISTGHKFDHSQIYASLKKLRDRSLIKSNGMRKSTNGGPLCRTYKVTINGEKIIADVERHHAAVSCFLK